VAAKRTMAFRVGLSLSAKARGSGDFIDGDVAGTGELGQAETIVLSVLGSVMFPIGTPQ
jgi:hypothetical protein